MGEAYRVTTTDGELFAFEKPNRHGRSTITLVPAPRSERQRKVIMAEIRRRLREVKACP